MTEKKLIIEIINLQNQVSQSGEREIFLTGENERLRVLSTKQDEYIKLLTDEINDLVGLASVHGWKSSRYEQGKSFRERIQGLREENERLKTDITQFKFSHRNMTGELLNKIIQLESEIARLRGESPDARWKDLKNEQEVEI